MIMDLHIRRSIPTDSTINKESNIKTLRLNKKINYRNRRFRLHYKRSTNTRELKREIMTIEIHVQDYKFSRIKLYDI